MTSPPSGDGPPGTDRRPSALTGFRAELHNCFFGWADALFELCDAVLCSPGRVASVPSLSLEPVFRRSHGSLYKALATAVSTPIGSAWPWSPPARRLAGGVRRRRVDLGPL